MSDAPEAKVKPIRKSRTKDEIKADFEKNVKRPTDSAKEKSSQNFMLELVTDLYEVLEKRLPHALDELMAHAEPGHDPKQVLAKSAVTAMNLAITQSLCNWEGTTPEHAHAIIITQHVEILRMATGGHVERVIELILKASGMIPADTDVQIANLGGAQGKRFKSTKEFQEFMQGMKTQTQKDDDSPTSVPKGPEKKLH
jgi:hypothetical protein